MKVSELTFDAGNTTQLFKLADGHRYYLHRVVRLTKPALYCLMGFDQLQIMTPYVTEGQMDTILTLRMGEDRKATPVPEFVSDTGFICPGCGATVDKDGAHYPPAPPAVAEPQCAECAGKIAHVAGCKGGEYHDVDTDPQCAICGEYVAHVPGCTSDPNHVAPKNKGRESRFVR